MAGIASRNVAAISLVSAVLLTSSRVVRAASECEEDSSLQMPALFRWLLIISLVLLSGLFSGLTLGLCGMDKLSLDVIVQSGTKKQKEYAQKILPVREDGNLLLCTLLLGNVAVNAALSILMAEVAGGTQGFLISTAVIVIMGEICPQSVCSRHPLPIGARAAPIVRVLIFLMYPVAKPIGMVLDYALGQEIAAKYSKEELLKLLQIQRTQHSVLTGTEARILEGALLFKEKTVAEVMTKLDKVFMLNVDGVFSFDLLFQVFKRGHSRIPVFEGNRENIVGLIFSKDLILISPDDEVPIRTIMQCHERIIHAVYDDATLEVVFNNFKTWRQHLALVQQVDEESEGDPVPKVVGIITLEDVIEELIEDEIVDETDNFVSNQNQERANQQSTASALFKMFDTRVHAGFDTLEEQESVAVHSYLRATFPDLFLKLSAEEMALYISKAPVYDVLIPVDPPQPYEPSPIFRQGDEYEGAVLVLQGRVEVESGKEGFKARLGPFSLLGLPVLSQAEGTSAISDFTAKPITSIRYILLTRSLYDGHVKNSQAAAVTHSSPAGNQLLQLHRSTTSRLRVMRLGTGGYERFVSERRESTESPPTPKAEMRSLEAIDRSAASPPSSLSRVVPTPQPSSSSGDESKDDVEIFSHLMNANSETGQIKTTDHL